MRLSTVFLENNFPQAANPEAVYGIKKITMKIAPIDCKIFFSSRYLLLKNDGNVIEFPAMCVYRLSLFATILQFKYVPIASPIAVHPASAIPVR